MILNGLLATLFLFAGTPDSGGDGLLLLDFHSERCGPCRQMRPEIQKLVDAGYPVRTIKLEEKPDLARRYDVTAVPTLIAVDADGRELDRSAGFRPAGEVATWFKQVRSEAAPSGPRAELASEEAETPAEEGEGPPVTSSRGTPIPKPWETTVRIRIDHGGPIVFGSGTIIHSTSEETIILTCAHIFKIEKAAKQPTPDRFPFPITVDLFDGIARGGGDRPAQVHKKESHQGQVIDYDYSRDVGLMRIRPGRRLAASPVVSPDWRPEAKARMITVGSSAGRDATAWETIITNPTVQWNNGKYHAIECRTAPIQGRSGGGLYTWDGYVAGVCDFAEATGNHGYYAAPASIYRLLDRNELQVAYEPRAAAPESEELVADAGTDRVGRVERLQSPEAEPRRRSPSSPSIPMPEPDLLGIEPPRVAARDDANAWRSVATDPVNKYSEETFPVTPADIELDRDASGDVFAPPAPKRQGATRRASSTRTTSAPDGWEVADRPWPGNS